MPVRDNVTLQKNFDKPAINRSISFIHPINTRIMTDGFHLTTSNSLEGYRVTKQLGLVRGITVRSRSLLGNMAGGFMTLFGGKSKIYTELCEKTREEALQLMIRHGQELGCNAIINMRYDANEVLSGVTEVLAYGTAVVVEKID
jgi:uncharacterized protein YbjQ (UPF0145 family)